MICRRLLVWLGFFVLLTLAPASATGLYDAVQRTTLPNGLQVWSLERPEAESVALRVAVRVGFLDETSQNYGLAHFTEHWMFTDTEVRTEEQVKAFISDRGGRWNGYTHIDRTVYQVDLPADFALDGVAWLGEILTASRFRADLDDRVRREVREEYRNSYAVLPAGLEMLRDLTGWGTSADRGTALFFPDSNAVLRSTRLGPALDGFDSRMAKDLGQRRYVAGNMALIAVGRIAHADLVRQAQQHFARLPAGPAPDFQPRTPPARPAQKVEVLETLPCLRDEQGFAVVFRTDGRASADRVAQIAALRILRNRLESQLVFQQSLADSIPFYFLEAAQLGVAVLFSLNDGQRQPQLLQAYRQQAQRLATEGPTAEELQQVQAELRGGTLRSLEDHAALAEVLTELYAALPEGADLPDPLAALDQLTQDRLRTVSSQLFAEPNQLWLIWKPAFALLHALSLLAAVLVLGLGWRWLRRRKRLAVAALLLATLLTRPSADAQPPPADPESTATPAAGPRSDLSTPTSASPRPEVAPRLDQAVSAATSAPPTSGTPENPVASGLEASDGPPAEPTTGGPSSPSRPLPEVPTDPTALPSPKPLQIQRASIPDGPEIWLHPTRSGTVALELLIRLGSRDDPLDQEGAAMLLREMLTAGTRNLDEEQVKTRIDRLGGSWWVWGDREFTRIGVHVPADRTEAGLAWMAEVAGAPRWDPAKLRSKRDLAVREGRWDPALDLLWFGGRQDRLVRSTLYAGCGLDRDPRGDADSLAGIQVADLQSLHQRGFRRGAMTVLAAGALDLPSLESLAQRHFREFPPGPADLRRPTCPDLESNPDPLEIIDRGPRLTGRSSVLVGFPTLGDRDPDRWALAIARSTLSKSIFSTLRDRLGLVYGARAVQESESDRGLFYLSAESEAANRPTLVREMEAALRNLAQNVDPAEVQRAKARLLGTTLRRRDSTLGMLSTLTSMAAEQPEGQLPQDPVAAIAALTPADLQSAMQRLVARRLFIAYPDPLVTGQTVLLSLGFLAILAGLWLWHRRRRKKQRPVGRP